MKDFIVKRPKGYVLVMYIQNGDIEYTDMRSWAFIYSGSHWREFWESFEDAELIECSDYA